MLLFGLALTAAAMRMQMHFSLDMDGRPVVISGLIQGFGFGFVALPINLIAFATIESRFRTQAASLYSLARSIGGSIAISVMSALLVRQGQVSHADLTGLVTSQSLPPLVGEGAVGGMLSMAASMANAEITRQSAMIAYDDAYMAMFWTIVAVMPLVLMMKPPRAMSAKELAEAAAVE
jgi:DHA2 family multidrug resistance protein